MELEQLCMGCMAERGGAERCPHCGWVEGTAPESPLHLPPRTILNEKYLLGRVLGQGGFGITYLGWDINLNLKLAIKEYMPQDLASRAAGQSQIAAYTGTMSGQFDYGLEKFLQEARTLAQFDGHPNIVSVRDFFKANGTAYIVMSFLDGVDLKEFVEAQGGRLPYEKALSLIMPVLDALNEVHAANILHRDISPDNIFIKRNGQVLLIDFGAARQAISAKGHSMSIILKPGFAPEEQYRSKGVQGPWTDLYAVAATMYRVTTGQMPPESLDRLAQDTLVPPSQLGVNLGANAEQALLRAMAIRAEDRFQRVRDFQDALLGKVAISAQAAPAPPAGATWHIDRDGARFGPYTWERMVQLAAAGNIGPRDQVWNEGMESWQGAAGIPGLLPQAAYPAGQGGPQSVSYTPPPPQPISYTPAQGPVSRQPVSYSPPVGPVSQQPVSYAPPQGPPAPVQQPASYGPPQPAAPKSGKTAPLLIGAALVIVIGLGVVLLASNWAKLQEMFNGTTHVAGPETEFENSDAEDWTSGGETEDPAPGKDDLQDEEDYPDGNSVPGGSQTAPGVIPPGGLPPVEFPAGSFMSLDPIIAEFTVYSNGGFTLIVDYTAPETAVDVNLKINYWQNDTLVYSLEDVGQLGAGTDRLTLNSDWSSHDLFNMGFQPGPCQVVAIFDGFSMAGSESFFTVE